MKDPRPGPSSWRDHFSLLEMEYLASLPKTQLNPAEFLNVWRYEQEMAGFEEGGRRKLNHDSDLYEVFLDLYKQIGDKINGNRFVKAVRAANLKCSNERAKKLVPIFLEQYEEE